MLFLSGLLFQPDRGNVQPVTIPGQPGKDRPRQKPDSRVANRTSRQGDRSTKAPRIKPSPSQDGTAQEGERVTGPQHQGIAAASRIRPA
jgi:hypothetical protein